MLELIYKKSQYLWTCINICILSFENDNNAAASNNLNIKLSKIMSTEKNPHGDWRPSKLKGIAHL